MKKFIILWAIVFAAIPFGFAQTVVLSEDFESAPYAVTSSGTPAWTINSRVHATGSFSDSCTVGLSSTSYLTTSAFSTTGNSSVLLEFKNICKIEMNDAAQIEYSIDGGTNWIIVSQTYYLGAGNFNSNKFSEYSYPTDWQLGTGNVLPTDTWWKTEQFDLSALVGNQASVMLRFKLTDGDNDGPGQRTGWYLDDLSVTMAPSELVPPTITLVPAIYQDTVYNSGPFNIKAKISDASGIASATLHYAINGGAYSTVAMNVLVSDTFQAAVPSQPFNTHIDYFVTAIDASLAANTASIDTTWFFNKEPSPVVIIGTGTTTTNLLPCHGYYKYGWSAQLYNSYEIKSSGPIDTLFFYVGNTPTAGYTMINQRIMLAEVPDTIFSSGTMPDSSQMSTYFAGDVVWTGPGWYKFVSVTPFYYSGTGSLVAYWINRRGSYLTGYPTFQYTATTTANKAMEKHSDTYSTVFPTSTGTMVVNRPNLKLVFNDNDNDVVVNQMIAPESIPTPVVGTPYNVTIGFANLGANTLTTLTLNWSLDGVIQTPFPWSGSLAQAQVSGNVTIGSVVFPTTGSHTIKVWSSLPNGVPDEGPQNDTITRTFNVCAVVLAGSYTIDPLQPTGGTNFKYFADVFSVLQNCGVSDTTVFNIAAGTYDTLLTFGSYPGVGPNASLIFQSASGVNTDVTLRNNASTSANNYVLKFNASKYIGFKNMTIKTLGTTYGKCIEIAGGSNHLLFEGNIIENPANTSSSTDMALINNTSAANDTAIIVRNNVLNNGSYSIYYYGVGSTSLESGNIIEGNTFSNFYYSGIYGYYQKNLLVKNNTMTTNSAYSSLSGMYLGYCDYSTVTSNKISVPTYYGLYFYYSDGDATKSSLIANNFITIGGTSTSYGLYSYYSNYVNIFHNSVNNYGTSTSTRALYLYYGGNINVKNNVLAATGGGYSYYVSPTTTIFTSDYNNLYTTGASIGYYSSARANLAAWITATLKDSNSVSMNPGFISQSNLHTFNLNMNDLGTPVGVTTDIDGDVRSLTTPDMGADEFSPAPEDAGVTAILEPVNSPRPITGNTYNVVVNIKNFGTDTLETASIGWSLDGVAQTPFAWSGSVLSGATATNVTIGTVVFPIAGSHSIKVWTSMPNAVADPNNLNDTAQASYTVCDFALAGTYTIDPLTPTGGTNYQYFSQVMSMLLSCGISDTTVFNIASGTYDTLLNFASEIPGTGPSGSVIFQSASGVNTDVTLRNNASAAANNYVLKFNASRYIEFKNMTIKALGTSYGKCIDMSGGTNHMIFEGNIIESPVCTSTSTDMALIFGNSASIDSAIVIRNNILNNGSSSIYIYGIGSSSLESASIIEGNTFSNFYYRGIYAYYQKDLLVRNNILNSNSVYSSIAGMQLSYSYYSTVTGNKINVPTYYGIYFYYSDGDTTKSSLIANNFISLGGTSTAYGIYPYYSDYVDIYHNSVNNYGTTTSARALYQYYSDNVDVKDNVFAATGGGYAYYLTPTTSVFTSDYNNLYSTGASVGYYGSAMANLAAWTTATLKDSNSLSTNPGFISQSNLHTFNLNMNDLGTPVGVTTDIDGEVRSLTTPDMGADEFSPAPEDGGVIAILEPVNTPRPITGNTYNVVVDIQNFGTDTLESASIGWSLDGVAQTPFAWNGSVLSGSTATNITIGTVVFPVAGNHVIKAWTSMPNAVVDLNNMNDTTQATYLVCDVVLAGTYTIDPLTPTGGNNYQYFAEVINQLQNCGINDTTVFNIAAGTYDTTLAFNGVIPGAGPSACVIFQSASGVNTDVTLRNNATVSASNYIVKLNGTSRVQFKNMTMLTQSKTYGTAVQIAGGSHYNLFEGNIFTGQDTASTSSNIALIYSSSAANDTNNVFLNNVFNYGSYGIYLYGYSSSNLEKNSLIEGNTFNNFYNYGIYSYYQKGIVIRGNTLTTSSVYSSVYGMYLYYSDYSIVEKNNVAVPTYYGIYSYECDADATTHSRIVNNMIQVGGTSTAYGLYASYCDYVDIYHNTINIRSTSTTGRAMYIYYGSYLNLKNNFFTNTGGGYAIYNYTTSTVFSSDYNNLFTTGSNLGYNGSAMSNLAAWRTSTGMDANSFSSGPLYVSATDLHSRAYNINNMGTALGVAEDIDAEPRNMLTPDMGADEYTPPPFEAYLIDIVAPVSDCGLGVVDVVIAIKNNGSDTINGGLNASYQVNGGTITTEGVASTILPGDTIEYTFTATTDMSAPTQDTTFQLSTWVTLAGDTIQMNDSISASVTSGYTPPAPTGINDTVPYATSATLSATSPDHLFWYDLPSGGTLLDTGMVFITPVLYDTTTYYVAAAAVSSTLNTLTTIYTGGNGCGGGSMFDVTALSNGVTIKGFNINTDSTSLITVNVYYKSGTSVGSETNAAAWTLLGAFTATGAGTNNPTPLTVDDIVIPAGQTYGIYLNFNANYTNGTGVYTDGTIQISAGTGLCGLFSSTNPGRDFNGAVLYTGGTGCESPRVPVTAYLTGVPANDLGVLSIDEPNSGFDLSNNEPVSVHIVNYGTSAASNFGISYKVNSLAPVTETYTGTIAPGDTVFYTFTATANLMSYTTYSLKAYPTLTGDVYPANDTAYKTVTNDSLVYCISAATSTADEDILNVTIGSLNNTSPAPHTVLYTDYTSVPAPYLAHGLTFPMSVTETDDALSYYNGFIEAYIDFNHDGIYQEPDEIVLAGAYTNANQSNTITSNVTIPLNAYVGTTGMRVVCRENGTAATVTPCGTYTYGETEDYLVVLAPLIPYDAGVISIDAPGYIQAESSTAPVVVSVKNYGLNALTSIPVHYVANGGTPVTYTWTGSLAAGDTVQIPLPDVTVIAGNNDICAYTAVLNDSNTFNDQSCAYFFGLPPTIIFEDDMEDGTQMSTDAPTLWEHGVPTASVINTAYSPDSVWATILDGDYPNSASGYIYTPTINFFGISGAYLAFYYWVDGEEFYDGGFVQYSVNNGATWISLGGINDPDGYNWFDSYVSGTPGWSKNSNGWKPAFMKLNAVSGYSNVKFRIGFKSNTTVVHNGMAIDDIKILGPLAAFDAGVVEILTPTVSTVIGQQITVQVRIKNLGSDTLTSVPVTYALNTGFPPQNGTWNGQLLPGDTTTFTFTQKYPGPALNYGLCAYTKLTTDPYKYNDSTCIDLTFVDALEDLSQNGVVLMQNVPNPAMDETEIAFMLPEPGQCVITLRNTLGDVILSASVDGVKGRNSCTFDLRNIEQGLYFYTLNFKDVTLTRKLSVTR